MTEEATAGIEVPPGQAPRAGALPSLRRVLQRRLLAVMGVLAAFVLLLYALVVGQLAEGTTRKEALRLGELAQARFLSQIRDVEGAGCILAASWEKGEIEPLALEDHPGRVWAPASRLRNLSGILLARTDGRTLSIQRGNASIITPLGGGESEFRSYSINAEAVPYGPPWVGRMPWDALTRPWFLAAREAQGPVWTRAYLAAGAIPCTTFALPVRASDGHLLGVVGVDYTLMELSSLLRDSLPTARSEAMLLDESGRILAFCGPGSDRKQEQQAFFLGTLPNPAFPGFGTAQGGDDLSITRDFGEAEGLHWRYQVRIPRSDLTPRPWNHLLGILLVILGSFALAYWQVSRVASKVVAPLSALAAGAGHLDSGTRPSAPHSSIHEIRVLEESLRQAWERHQERQWLREQVLHLERVQLAGTMTSGIAHDLGNILNAAKLNLEVVRETLPVGADPSGPASRHLQASQDALDRGARLIRSLLNFCKSVEGERRPLDLNVLVQDTEPILRTLLTGKVRLEIEASPTPPRVLGNPVQLEQVLINLAVNGRDAMAAGGRLRIQLSGPLEGWCQVRVEDEGGGIPPLHLPRIFEPFYTTKADGAGTGLGLAMVRQIIEDHGGAVNVQNLDGRGCAFTLKLRALGPDHP